MTTPDSTLGTGPSGSTDRSVATAPTGVVTTASPGPLRTAVVFNPARVEDIDERRSVVEATLAEAGWPAPVWIETTAEDPGAGQSRRAVEDGAQVVFACGGDGTVRSCVEGVAGTDAALAVLPAGTGNLLATNLGLPDDPAAGVQVVLEGGRRRIDIGDVDGQAFAVMAGMGFDAALLDDASTTLKAKIGPVAYVLSALQHLRDRRMTVHVRLDDRAPVRRRARTVVIGNVGRLQGGVRLLADAEPDNGLMDVAVLNPRHLGHWLALAWGVVRRRRDIAHMQVLRAARIVVSSTEVEPRQLDGDVIEPGRTLSVTVRPAALELCVPQPERSADLAEGSERLGD
ncbi:MAG: diacylglycerol kinase [Actinotalea sp.]|nr:diacylglycerol kinase [Actinotalea sp.]